MYHCAPPPSRQFGIKQVACCTMRPFNCMFFIAVNQHCSYRVSTAPAYHTFPYLVNCLFCVFAWLLFCLAPLFQDIKSSAENSYSQAAAAAASSQPAKQAEQRHSSTRSSSNCRSLLLHAQLTCSSITAARANTGSPSAFYDTPHLGQ